MASTQQHMAGAPPRDWSSTCTPTPIHGIGFSLILCACHPQSVGVEAPVESAPSDSASLVSVQDLPYTLPTGTDPTLATLDLYRPDDEVLRPLVVLVHGGSWVGGDKSAFATAAPDFIPWWIDQGYAIAAVNFRLATPVGQTRVVGPVDQASDIAHAIAWTHARAAEHHIDNTRPITLVGYSSGAHLVALLGADGRLLASAGLDPTTIGATVSLDVHVYDVPHALSLMEGSVVEQNIPLIRHLFGSTEAEQLQGSPIAYVDDSVAPALLVSVGPSHTEPSSHGYIVQEAARHYAAALEGAGHSVTTVHDSDETHNSLAVGFGAAGDAVTEAVGAFLESLP